MTLAITLLRLLSEAKSFTLPVQSVPADITRSRDVYFAYHPEWDDLEDPAPAAVDKPTEESLLNKQLAALQLEPVETHQDGEQENRFVSNNAGSLSQFFAALLADDSLTAEQRHALAQARLGLYAARPMSRFPPRWRHFPPTRPPCCIKPI